MHLQSARDVYYRFTLHYKKENLVVERNLGVFLILIQTINKQNKGIMDITKINAFGNLAPLCSVILLNTAFNKDY